MLFSNCYDVLNLSVKITDCIRACIIYLPLRRKWTYFKYIRVMTISLGLWLKKFSKNFKTWYHTNVQKPIAWSVVWKMWSAHSTENRVDSKTKNVILKIMLCFSLCSTSKKGVKSCELNIWVPSYLVWIMISFLSLNSKPTLN